LFSDLESKTLLKTDRPKDPGGIFDRSEIVENPDHFFFYIFYSSKKIDQLAERFWIELDGQGVNGKVPPIEVCLNGSLFYRRQGCRRIIEFPASGGHIDFQPVREKNDCCPKFFMCSNSAGKHFFEFLRQANSISFHHNIHIEVFHPQ